MALPEADTAMSYQMPKIGAIVCFQIKYYGETTMDTIGRVSELAPFVGETTDHAYEPIWVELLNGRGYTPDISKITIVTDPAVIAAFEAAEQAINALTALLPPIEED
jgi:hypothetical protein